MDEQRIQRKYKPYVPVSYERTCKYCGANFTAHDKRKVFCSKRCKDISSRLARGIECNINTEPYHKTCIVCGKQFDTYRESTATCSHECAVINYGPKTDKQENSVEQWVNEKHGVLFQYVSHEKKRIRLKCNTCGNIIERAMSTARQKNIECEYCKEAKQLQEARQKMMCFFYALSDAKTPKTCAYCGKQFYSSSPTKKYCSDICKKKSKGNRSSYRSRCRHYGVYYDTSVTRTKVLERDKYKCQICGKECDKNDTSWGFSGPDFPTLDHIIPLAKGGTHTWNNVQCACGMCNSNKRDLLGYIRNERCR